MRRGTRADMHRALSYGPSAFRKLRHLPSSCSNRPWVAGTGRLILLRHKGRADAVGPAHGGATL